jgi:hypothetical protein
VPPGSIYRDPAPSWHAGTPSSKAAFAVADDAEPLLVPCLRDIKQVDVNRPAALLVNVQAIGPAGALVDGIQVPAHVVAMSSIDILDLWHGSRGDERSPVVEDQARAYR